ncbi:hypothetical protein FPY71_09870 [Aureimonas fodinaquatilis]|uniref:Methylmalonyl-CoA mutase alpha/beta chain catalytic domain-containing protein n=1 Tax=Aureimonas fodinaquatilis TaxID=2565783 RepID=A0A5B0DWF8_9HYPH|nr:methylmalonyl-CoA mutase family protein [Aureimonas fodinaquatilis]KAA0970773.1 hypothetical protein FPY71_09870 [Aureimonas fodinaquatilis]
MQAGQGYEEQEAAWRSRVAKVLKDADFETLCSQTLEGFALQPLYRAVEVETARSTRQRPDLPWKIFQRLDHPEPLAAADLALADLAGGATGLEICFDGAPAAYGFGIAARDLAEALRPVELDRISLALALPDGDEAACVEAVLAVMANQRLTPDLVHISFGLNPLAANANLAQKLLACGFGGPIWRADGRVHHNAGASAAQELAAVLSTSVAALRCLETLGESLENASDLISLHLSADADEFIGVAKFRALRQLWGEVAAACNMPAQQPLIGAETSLRMVTRQDAATNLLRNMLGAFSAAIGGADSISILPHTIAVGLGDAMSRRTARNLQILLLEESHLAAVADPAAGSGAFESITASLVGEAWALFQELEAQGGIVAAMGSGAWQAELANTRAARLAAIESGQQPILGTTRFINPDDRQPSVLLPGPRFTSPLGVYRDAQSFESESEVVA